MDEYIVAVYSYIVDAYYAVERVDNYYDGVIETIAAAKSTRSKAVLVQDGSVIYVCDSRR